MAAQSGTATTATIIIGWACFRRCLQRVSVAKARILLYANSSFYHYPSQPYPYGPTYGQPGHQIFQNPNQQQPIFQKNSKKNNKKKVANDPKKEAPKQEEKNKAETKAEKPAAKETAEKAKAEKAEKSGTKNEKSWRNEPESVDDTLKRMVFVVGDLNFYGITATNKDGYLSGIFNGKFHFISILFDANDRDCYSSTNRTQIISAVKNSKIPISVILILPGALPNQVRHVYEQIMADFKNKITFKIGFNFLPNNMTFKQLKDRSKQDFEDVLKVRKQLFEFYNKNFIDHHEPYSLNFHWFIGYLVGF